MKVNMTVSRLGLIHVDGGKGEFQKPPQAGRARRNSFGVALRYIAFILFLAFLGNFGALPVWAQVDYATATLRGTIYDPQGLVVPAATVTATNPATGLRQTEQTGGDGTYQMQALPPGAYEVAVEAKGFSRAVLRDLILTVGQTVAYDFHLSLGPFSLVVTVTDRPSLIETEQTQQANTVDHLQVVNLPNISRNFTEAIYTVPGVVNSQAPSIQDPNIGTGYLASGFSIGGSNGRNNL